MSASWQAQMLPVVVLDNGGGSIKAGFAGQQAPVRVFPNATGKAKGERQALVGDMLADTKEVSQLALRRPFDRGYLVNWELERDIWSRCFRSVLRCAPPDTGGLALSEPLFNFDHCREATQQAVFEEFGFRSMFAAPAPLFSLRRAAALQPHLPASSALSGVVVDAGFSFTHVVPIFNGQVLPGGVRRINLGGKAMTNYLKELVSYRSLNMMDEPYLMDLIKEQLCFVSAHPREDLAAAQVAARSPHRREYVLPDGVHNLRGYVRDPEQHAARVAELRARAAAAQAAGDAEGRKAIAAQLEVDQVLVLNNERFMVPELLFHPDDIGLQQAGVAEAVVQAVTGCHPALAPLLFSNVVLTGGVASCPGFLQRFEAELRPLVPCDYSLNCLMPQDPALLAWEGMAAWAATPQYAAAATTRAQYEEAGHLSGVRQYM